MSKKHQIYRHLTSVFFLLFTAFMGQNLFAKILFIPQTQSFITFNDISNTGQGDTESYSSWNIIIDTSTGRYLWSEIQTLQINSKDNNQRDPVLMYIPNENILNILQTSESYHEAHTRIRLLILQQMISKGFSGFISTPISDGNEKLSLLTNTGFADFILLEDIPETDSLDNLVLNKIAQYRNIISQISSPRWLEITQKEYDTLNNIYLFKSNEDLYNLWYELVSYRYRNNNDAEYRRHNINLAFSRIGNVRIINPSETFSFQDTIRQSSIWKFMAGPSIVKGKITYLYWWWLCGASTAFYQWILTNTAVEMTERSPHTQRYANLYDSFVNGEAINTPGLDSTVFSSVKDVKITNTRNYPLVVVLNYDWSKGGREEAFSLAKNSDKWSLVYKGKDKKCYTREINGSDISSCYQKIH